MDCEGLEIQPPPDSLDGGGVAVEPEDSPGMWKKFGTVIASQTDFRIDEGLL